MRTELEYQQLAESLDLAIKQRDEAAAAIDSIREKAEKELEAAWKECDEREATLRAENERLKAEHDGVMSCLRTVGDFNALTAERDALKAEVERLQKENNHARRVWLGSAEENERIINELRAEHKRAEQAEQARDEAVTRAERAETALRDAHKSIARGDHGPEMNARCLIAAAISLKEQATEAEATCAAMREALERLRDWDMLGNSSWLADAPWARGIVTGALSSTAGADRLERHEDERPTESPACERCGGSGCSETGYVCNVCLGTGRSGHGAG